MPREGVIQVGAEAQPEQRQARKDQAALLSYLDQKNSELSELIHQTIGPERTEEDIRYEQLTSLVIALEKRVAALEQRP